jgi:hypothetical protein
MLRVDAPARSNIHDQENLIDLAFTFAPILVFLTCSPPQVLTELRAQLPSISFRLLYPTIPRVRSGETLLQFQSRI